MPTLKKARSGETLRGGKRNHLHKIQAPRAKNQPKRPELTIDKAFQGSSPCTEHCEEVPSQGQSVSTSCRRSVLRPSLVLKTKGGTTATR